MNFYLSSTKLTDQRYFFKEKSSLLNIEVYGVYKRFRNSESFDRMLWVIAATIALIVGERNYCIGGLAQGKKFALLSLGDPAVCNIYIHTCI